MISDPCNGGSELRKYEEDPDSFPASPRRPRQHVNYAKPAISRISAIVAAVSQNLT